ncbi:hypothetical protein G7046_g5339 [Stylonectria norvegica]|nr:hypothetical protein G7046_g5339 [Stylonectria norvegica]
MMPQRQQQPSGSGPPPSDTTSVIQDLLDNDKTAADFSTDEVDRIFRHHEKRRLRNPPSDLSDVPTADLPSDPGQLPAGLLNRKLHDVEERIRSDPRTNQQFQDFIRFARPELAEQMEKELSQHEHQDRESHQRQRSVPAQTSHPRRRETHTQPALLTRDEIEVEREQLEHAHQQLIQSAMETLQWEREVHRISARMQILATPEQPDGGQKYLELAVSRFFHVTSKAVGIQQARPQRILRSTAWGCLKVNACLLPFNSNAGSLVSHCWHAPKPPYRNEQVTTCVPLALCGFKLRRINARFKRANSGFTGSYIAGVRVEDYKRRYQRHERFRIKLCAELQAALLLALCSRHLVPATSFSENKDLGRQLLQDCGLAFKYVGNMTKVITAKLLSRAEGLLQEANGWGLFISIGSGILRHQVWDGRVVSEHFSSNDKVKLWIERRRGERNDRMVPGGDGDGTSGDNVPEPGLATSLWNTASKSSPQWSSPVLPRSPATPPSKGWSTDISSKQLPPVTPGAGRILDLDSAWKDYVTGETALSVMMEELSVSPVSQRSPVSRRSPVSQGSPASQWSPVMQRSPVIQQSREVSRSTILGAFQDPTTPHMAPGTVPRETQRLAASSSMPVFSSSSSLAADDRANPDVLASNNPFRRRSAASTAPKAVSRNVELQASSIPRSALEAFLAHLETPGESEPTITQPGDFSKTHRAAGKYQAYVESDAADHSSPPIKRSTQAEVAQSNTTTGKSVPSDSPSTSSPNLTAQTMGGLLPVDETARQLSETFGLYYVDVHPPAAPSLSAERGHKK